MPADKTCSRCQQVKSVDKFSRDRSRPDGYQYWCKVCVKTHNEANADQLVEKHKAYYKVNHERIRMYHVTYNEANPHIKQNLNAKHIALKRGADPDLAELVDRRVVWGRDEGHCRRCHVFVPFNDMHMDHIIPIVKGGQHTYNNVQTLCEPCNRIKYNKEELYT